jgi:hypothetical protein
MRQYIDFFSDNFTLVQLKALRGVYVGGYAAVTAQHMVTKDGSSR